jgi:uncharacterized protein YbjT (DUF2867 family)
MSNQLVLVTGAAGGQQGQTGRHVSELLLARGVPVRAFIHQIDERSDRLRTLGAEVVEGDFLDFHSVERAVRGVSTVYFAYPVQAGLLDATAIMADAARKAGVTRLIDMVMLISSPDAPTPRMRQNYLSEQIFEWAGIGAAHVRATVFYENVRALTGSSLAKDGTILLPWGSDGTIIPLVSGEDVARVAAGGADRPLGPPRQFIPGDRRGACPAGHRRDFQPGSGPPSALPRNPGRPLVHQGSGTGTQSARRRASVAALACDPYHAPQLGDVEADQHGRNPGRQKTQDVRRICARGAKRFSRI